MCLAKLKATKENSLIIYRRVPRGREKRKHWANKLGMLLQ